jgi:ribonuclease BN (tRNA processing enzyme)
MPDHEPSLGVDLRTLGPEWVSGCALAHGADLLMHDAQYTEAEYPAHVGWGHSSIEHVVVFAEMAEVKRLLLFHHDPLHTDDELEELMARARQLCDGKPMSLDMAYEGMEIALTPATP